MANKYSEIVGQQKQDDIKYHSVNLTDICIHIPVIINILLLQYKYKYHILNRGSANIQCRNMIK